MSDDAEGFEEKNPLGPGRSVGRGFQDPSGTYPRPDRIGSDTEPRARGQENEVRTGYPRYAPRIDSRRRRIGVVVGRSTSKAKPVYPKNQVTHTASGHTVELDDTPGYERVRLRHRTGSQVEMHANGDIEIIAAGSAYTLITRDQEVVIRGSCSVVIESSVDLRIRGDLNLEVEGDLNQLVGGNHNLEVLGGQTQRVHGDVERLTTGGLLESTRGDVIRRNLSNYRERTVGDHGLELGGEYRCTAEGAYRLRAYGQLQASFCGGLLTVNGQDADGNAGEGQMVADRVFASETHGGYIFVAEELHSGAVYARSVDVDGSVHADAVHAPTLEGTAARANWATTAGSAPTGVSTPVTPAPQSPTAGQEGDQPPTSLEDVVPVTTTSDDFIIDLDRRPINGLIDRAISFSEARQRLRNPVLLNNGEWLRELVATGAITEDIGGGRAPATVRRWTNVALVNSSPKILSIPQPFIIDGQLNRSTRLSPNFRLSNLLGDAPLRAQLGLSAVDRARNLQLLAWNVLEPLVARFGYELAVVEGLYDVWPEETIAQDSIALEQAQGLCVGLTCPDRPASVLYETATWLQRSLAYDRLVLSYTSYDPTGVDEPVLLVSIRPAGCRGLTQTHFNHVPLADNLLELADDA